MALEDEVIQCTKRFSVYQKKQFELFYQQKLSIVFYISQILSVEGSLHYPNGTFTLTEVFILHRDTNLIGCCSHCIGPGLCYNGFTLTETIENCLYIIVCKCSYCSGTETVSAINFIWQIRYNTYFIDLGISLGLCQCERIV